MIRRIIKREIGRCRKYGRYNYAIRRWLSDMNVLFGGLFGYTAIVTVGGGASIAFIHLRLVDSLARGRISLIKRDVLMEAVVAIGIVLIDVLQYRIGEVFPRKASKVGFRERTRLEYEASRRKVNAG